MNVAVPPTPQTTLVILLGASAWPRWPDLDASEAFANSARGVRDYFLNPQKFRLPHENLLDLFDADQSADDLDEAINQFLATRLTEMRAPGQAARDVLVYFIGHAGFAEESLDYYLAIRRTRKSNPETSGLRMVSLAKTLKENTRHLRRLIILDCCYAASAFSAFQAQGAGLEQAAIVQTVDAFRGPRPRKDLRHSDWPKKGTALLCSSSRNKPSLLGEQFTEFSGALLHILHTGAADEPQEISLHMVADLVREFLNETESEAPRPEVHSPDQSEGDIADIPFFPNPRAEEERARKAEEAERTRRVEEERLRRFEEEHARKPEKERVHKAREGQPSTRFPHPASTGILQGLRLRQLSWRKAGLLLILALLILGSAGGLFATVRIPTTRKQAATTAKAQASATEQILNPTTVGGLMKKWAYRTGASVRSSPAVVNGVVYVGSDDGNLYALDAATGTKKWAYQASLEAVVSGVVYIDSYDGNLYALDAATGAKKWAYRTGGANFSSPVVVGGVVYVGSDDHNLYALDAATGTKKWAYQTGGAVNWPAVVGGVVYVGSDDNNLYALDAATGTKKWAYNYHIAAVVYLLAVVGGMAYVDSADGTLWALDAATGTKKWTYQTGGITKVPTLVGGVVYVGQDDGTLWALDAATGTKKWAYQIGGVADAPVVVGGVVYVGSDDNNLYAFHLPGT